MQLEDARALKLAARTALDLALVDGERASPSVTLGIGLKEDDKEEGPGDYLLTARIRTPKPLPGFEERVRGILRGLAGDELDLLYTGPVFALRPIHRNVAQVPTLMIGASVSHYQTLGGTLGFFARDRNDGTFGLVSANHVIGNLNDAKPGDPIVSPEGANEATNTVAKFVRLTKLVSGRPLHTDAAFAKLTTNDFDLSVLPNGQKLSSTIAHPHETRHVRKFGMKTHLTSGRVRSFELDDFETDGYYGLGTIRFDDQIEVESSKGQDFANEGDSGSAVLSKRLHPVGLLFATTFGFDLAYVNPIKFVLDELCIDLAV
jgi:hypothetical protein